MKSIIDTLHNIQDLGIYPVISLLIFFLFLVAVGIWVFTMSKARTDEMKNLPFNE